MFGIFSLLYAIVLGINAIVILDEKRVLEPLGLSFEKNIHKESSHIRQRIVDLIILIRTIFEFPLLIINTFFILYEIFLG